MEPSRQRIKIHPLSFDLIIPSDTLLMGCKIEKRKGSLKREVDEFRRGFGIWGLGFGVSLAYKRTSSKTSALIVDRV